MCWGLTLQVSKHYKLIYYYPHQRSLNAYFVLRFGNVLASGIPLKKGLYR